MDEHDTQPVAPPDVNPSADPYGSPAVAVPWMLSGLVWLGWVGYLLTAPLPRSLAEESLAFTVVVFGVIPGVVIALLAAILLRLRRLTP